MKHIIYKELIYFQKFVFIQKYKQKKLSLPKQLYAFFTKICKKKIQNSFVWRKKNWKKRHAIFFWSNVVGSFYLVLCPFTTTKPHQILLLWKL